MLIVEESVLAKTKSLSKYIRTEEEPVLKKVSRENILSEEEMKEEYQERIHDHRIEQFTKESPWQI